MLYDKSTAYELCYMTRGLTLPHDKTLNTSTLKAFAEYKLTDAKMVISVYDDIENILEKEEMLVITIVSFFHNVFKSFLFQGQ